MPIFHKDVPQGTSRWLELRAGIPTASAFDSIITPSGKPSKSAERYLYTLLAERLLGKPITEHISFWMERGSQLEREAVDFYEMQAGLDTELVGFVTNDDGTIGASPDRLVGEVGLLEVKAPSYWVHVGSLLKSGAAFEAHKIQCAGQLWITGREWVDLLSYNPGLPPALIRIERDESYIQILSTLVTTFSMELERLTAIAESRGWLAHQRMRTRSEDSPWHAIREEARQILSMEL